MVGRDGPEVSRSVSASVTLEIPQKAVDQEGWLTPGQWSALLAALNQALSAEMEQDVVAGRPPDLAALADSLHMPFSLAGIDLPAEKQEVLQQRLRDLLSQAKAAPATEIQRVEVRRHPLQPRGRLSCSVGLILLLIVIAVAARCAPLALEPGGVSIDFTGLGVTEVTGDNLITNPDMATLNADGSLAAWQRDSYVWLPVSDPATQAAMHERLKRLMNWQAKDGAAYLSIPSPAYRADEPAGHEFCAIYHQHVVLPPLDKPAKYVLSCRARGFSDRAIPNSRPYFRATFYDAPDPASAGQTRVYAQNIFAPTTEWRQQELVFTAPAATRSVDLRLALTGGGEIYFDDISLRRAALQETGPGVRLMPAAFLDNTYCLASGDASTMIFGFRNESDANLDQPRLVLQLPVTVEVVDVAPTVPLLEPKPISVGDAAFTEYTFDLTGRKASIRGSDFAYPYNQWDGLSLLVRTRDPAGSRHRARYWLQDGDYRSEPISFELRVLPALPVVQDPKRFRSGTHPFIIHGFTKPEAIAAFTRLYKQSGLNSIHLPACPLGAALGEAGIERYAQPFANGYSIGPSPKPDSAVFRDADGKPVPEAICPVEVYQRGPYYREQIERGLIRRILVEERSAEQFMCNWEPFMYDGRGCFCDRCKAEFSAYSKLPVADVATIWPKTVVTAQPDLYRKFRSWQHGKLMATIEQSVVAAGEEAEHEAHFIPEVHYGLLTESWPKWGHFGEYAAVDYLDQLPLINAWAPYNWFIFGRGPYEYLRGQHLSCHVTATEVQDFVAGRLPPEKRTRLIAFPYGTYEGATPPEAIAFEMLTYFFDRYHGAFVYLYPGGYDARYWRALAEMNRQMGLVEDYVVDGVPAQEHRLTPVTKLPRPDPRYLKECGPVDQPERWKDISLLQSWEFKRGNNRLFAVGNFWEESPCFYRLTPRDLKPGTRYVLCEPAANRVYTNRQGSVALTAADLSAGLLLHTGALRYSTYVLEPYRAGKTYGEPVRPQDMEAAMPK